ncbi:Glutamyl-tRNA reductase [Planctomycetes bacterium Pan216]|uniref:Glutamyl-tRNA reductase n=1 Tax=Kolteria novifilia TaxID=2527975 RepID=A0A518B1Y6_9BACT|nr:Glutamyl-tRNA reductase [Planctomycetes bacterium Pan216]
MKLLCVGLNWKTPVKIREQLSFDAEEAQGVLAKLQDRFPNAEFAVLSTCNRTEIYSAEPTQESSIGVEGLCEFFAEVKNQPLSEFYDYLYLHEDAGTALHLFNVASGLDSLILGEAQILGQVKIAYQQAIDCRTIGKILHPLFQRALGVAKRVHTETSLAKGRLSIASAAIDYLRGVFETFSDKRVLVIGAGKMAELVMVHLRELEPGRVEICNRTEAPALDLAQRMGGHYRPMAELHQALADADIVVSSTGAEEPIVKSADFAKLMEQRRSRWLAVIDIAVPRDFDPAIADFDNVWLWNIDDLEKVRYKTIRSRERELDHALKIIDHETAAFEATMAIKQSGPVIGRLEAGYQEIIEQELDWLLPQLNGLPEDQKEKIRYFAHRLKNKFLHPPKAALRAQAHAGEHHGLLDAFRKLFGLET